MDEFDDLDISLIDADTGRTFAKQNTEKTVTQNSYRSRRWAIEAEADQKFAIDIILMSTFEWAGSNCLEVKLTFDVGEEVFNRSIYILRSRDAVAGVNLPYFTYNDAVGSSRIDHILNEKKHKTFGNAQRCYFYFRRLRPDTLVDSAGRSRIIGEQGVIRLSVARHIATASTHDRGLEAHVRPGYSRQTQPKLQQRNITLEVLLHGDPAERGVEYEQRFRLCRPKPDMEPFMFSFVYRETGRHKPFVPLEDIDEIHGAVQIPLKKRQNPRNSTKSTPDPRTSTTPQEVIVEPRSFRPISPALIPTQSDKRSTVVIDFTNDTEETTNSQTTRGEPITPFPQDSSVDEDLEDAKPVSRSRASRRGIKRGLGDLLQEQIDRATNEVKELKHVQRQVHEIEDKYRAYQETMRKSIQASRESEATRIDALDRCRDAIKQMNTQHMMLADTEDRNRNED